MLKQSPISFATPALWRCSLMVCIGILCFTFGSSHAATLRVYAAASLMESLQEIGSEYRREHGTALSFNFGASSLLARQIAEGAPADVFFSADEAQVDALQKKGLLVESTRRSLLSNALVIVVAAESTVPIRSPQDLTRREVRRLALADPKTVPAGIYAMEYLQKAGLWPLLDKKVVPTDNVRAALSAVEAGNADAGIVYKTDAGISRKVKVAFEVPAKDAPAISYSLAVVKGTKQNAEAIKFLEHLASRKARRVFEKYGFSTRE